MARSYAPVLVSVWGDPDWQRLSVEAQRVYLLALSQPGTTYAGVVAYTAKRWARMAADTGPGDVERAVAQLVRARFVVVDEETEELFIRSFVKHNGVLAQPQLRKSMHRAFADILSPAIRQAFLDELPADERTLLAPCPQPDGRVPEGSTSPPGQEPGPIPAPEPRPGPSPAMPPTPPGRLSTPGSLIERAEPHGPVAIQRETTAVLDRVDEVTDAPITPAERKRLRTVVEDALRSGYSSGDLVAAIASSPFRTEAGVMGELRKRRAPARGPTSVGNRGLEAVGRFLGEERQ